MFSQDVEENNPSLYDIPDERPRRIQDIIGDAFHVEPDPIMGIK